MADLRLAGRITRSKPSASIVVKKRVAKISFKGRNIVDLTIGEPDFDTPDHIIVAANYAMRRGDTH